MIIDYLFRDKNIVPTEVQSQIINYIEENLDEAIFLNASRLALKVGVSEASVVRLAQKLGFDGYPGLRKELQTIFQNNLNTVTRINKTKGKQRQDSDILLDILQEDINNLNQTIINISTEAFCQAIEEMYSANKIYIAGFKEAHAPAMVLSNSLSYFMDNVILLEPKIGQIWDRVFNINDNDLVIGISFPRYMKITVEILKYAFKKGARVGAITNSSISPLSIYSHWILTAHVKLDSFIESFTAPMSVINAIITALSVKDKVKTMKILNEREKLWKDKNIYEIYTPEEK